MSRYDHVTVTVQLDPLVVLALDAMCSHLRQDRSSVVSDAVRCLFGAIPRPDDLSKNAAVKGSR